MIREIDTVTIYIGRKKYILPYRIRTYEDLNEQQIKILRKRVSSKFVDGKRLYLKEIENVPLEERTENIINIFKIKMPEGRSLEEHLLFLWETKFFQKNQQEELTDECTHVLEALANYYIAGHEGDLILDKNDWERIRKYEVASFNEEISDDAVCDDNEKRMTIDKMDKDKKAKKEAYYKGQTLRWKNSRTKKLDNIRSYDNFYETEMVILGEKVLVSPRMRVKYDRVIDCSKPYQVLWATVDTTGSFIFDDKCFIAKSKEYKCNPLADEGFCQDKILCYEQNGKYFFFDMMINQVKEVEEKE
jgi:hypothetical protein